MSVGNFSRVIKQYTKRDHLSTDSPASIFSNFQYGESRISTSSTALLLLARGLIILRQPIRSATGDKQLNVPAVGKQFVQVRSPLIS